MIRPDFVRALSKAVNLTLRLLWAGLTGSPILFAVVGYVVVTGDKFSAGGLSELVKTVLVGLAIALIAVAVTIRRIGENADWLVPSVPNANPQIPPALKVAPDSDDERRVIGATQRYQTLVIVTLALAESGAVLGLVLTMLSGAPMYVATLAPVVVLVDVVFLRPDADIVSRLAEAVQRTPSI